MLPASLLPVMFPVTRKKCWLVPWMEGGDRVWGACLGPPCPCASRSPATQELAVPPHKAKGPFPNLRAKSVITLFWTHLHFPGCSFLHFSFQQQSHCLLSPLHRIFSCFSQSDVGFYFLFFPSVQPPCLKPPNHHPVHLQQKCKLQKLFVFHGHSHIMPKWCPKSLAGNLNPRIRELMMNGCEAFVIAQAPLWLEQWSRTQVWLRRATDKTVGENGGLLPTWPLVDIERIQKQVSRNRNDSVRWGY